MDQGLVTRITIGILVYPKWIYKISNCKFKLLQFLSQIDFIWPYNKIALDLQVNIVKLNS
jgi:hypothetical protein